MIILGCESSCDDTSIGILKERKILSNVVFSQDHSNFGGVFPEFASREHLNKISLVYDRAIEEAKISKEDIDYVAATYAPGLVGSLVVGYSFAKSLSLGLNRPFIPVHHIKGHIYAAMLENQVALPAIALVVSGGHTSLVYVDENHNFKEIGYTLDDAAGEVYDKVGRMVGLNFPAGALMDSLAQKGEENIKMPVARVEGYNFSFSGLKSFVYRYLEKNNPKIEDLAASFQKSVVSALVPKSVAAFKEYEAESFILAGGVAANSSLRQNLREVLGDKLFYPSIKLCLDNGAMIAAAAHYMIKYDKIIDDVKITSNLKLS